MAPSSDLGLIWQRIVTLSPRDTFSADREMERGGGGE